MDIQRADKTSKPMIPPKPDKEKKISSNNEPIISPNQVAPETRHFTANGTLDHEPNPQSPPVSLPERPPHPPKHTGLPRKLSDNSISSVSKTNRHSTGEKSPQKPALPPKPSFSASRKLSAPNSLLNQRLSLTTKPDDSHSAGRVPLSPTSTTSELLSSGFIFPTSDILEPQLSPKDSWNISSEESKEEGPAPERSPTNCSIPNQELPELPAKPASSLSPALPRNSSFPAATPPHHSQTSHIVFKTTRNSVAIANQILASKEIQISGKQQQLSPQNQSQVSSNATVLHKVATFDGKLTQLPPSASNANARASSEVSSPRPPLTPARPTTLSPRPLSNVFNFPPAEPRRSDLLKGKSASLGRNATPPSPSSGSFKEKATTLARSLFPLDLSFLNSNKPPPAPRNNSQAANLPTSPVSPIQSFGKNITFAENSKVPPPPPPRKKKSISPSSPPPDIHFGPPLATPEFDNPDMLYAKVDKKKKWAERQQKELLLKSKSTSNVLDTVQVDQMSTSMSTARVDDVDPVPVQQGSLVISINRENSSTSRESPPVRSVSLLKGTPEQKSSHSTSVTRNDSWLIRNFNPDMLSPGGNNSVANNKYVVERERELVDKPKEIIPPLEAVPPCSPGGDKENSSSPEGPQESQEKEIALENECNLKKDVTAGQALQEKSSFLFSHLKSGSQAESENGLASTVSGNSEDGKCCDSNSQKKNEPQSKLAEEVISSDSKLGDESFAIDYEAEVPASPNTLITKVDSTIKAAVSRLAPLSGKTSPSEHIEELKPNPTSEPLIISEADIVENGKDSDCGQRVGKSEIPTGVSPSGLVANSSAIGRRRSWNCSGDSYSSLSDSQTSLNNTGPGHPGNRSWVDEGESTGRLGDVDSSDTTGQTFSSLEDMGISTSCSAPSSISRKKRSYWLFSSFGKSGSHQTNRNKARHTKLTAADIVSRPSIANVISPASVTNSTVGGHGDSKSLNGSVGGDSPKLGELTTPSDADSLSICSGSSVSTISTSTVQGYPLPSSQICFEEVLEQLSSPEDRQLFFVAREILTSEQTFVDVLKLLTVDFPAFIRNVEDVCGHPIIPPIDLDLILAGLPNLKRVNEELVEDFKARVANWVERPKIADVFVKKGPFLKAYAQYIKDFTKTTKKLDDCCQQNQEFARALAEFESSDRCHKLQLTHYMLKPVQRMPQYLLLLKDYQKYLPKDSEDLEDTIKALEIVKEAAEHANDAIRLQVNAEKLMHLQSRLQGQIIMRANRQLLKEGELLKVCRKGLQSRFFALMSDCLLHMQYVPGSPAKDLKLRNELSLAGMKVALSPTEDYKYEFTVISVKRSFNLVAKDEKERDEWMKALDDAIYEYIKQRTCSTPDREPGFELGKVAPVWIQDSRVTMCQICTAEFTAFFRRHHCRSCGKVVCGHCSGNQAPLQYLSNEAERVCDECYQFLLDEFDKECSNNGDASKEAIRAKFKKVTLNISKHAAKAKRHVPSRLEVCANNSGSRISSYLHWRSKKKSWKRNWFVLMDRVLYIYAASEDIVASGGSIPVLGWQVEFEKEESMDGTESDSVFKLMHTGQKTLFFQAENASLAERWVNAMKEATVLT